MHRNRRQQKTVGVEKQQPVRFEITRGQPERVGLPEPARRQRLDLEKTHARIAPGVVRDNARGLIFASVIDHDDAKRLGVL